MKTWYFYQKERARDYSVYVTDYYGGHKEYVKSFTTKQAAIRFIGQMFARLAS
jgi:hypothetical protein